MTFAKKLSKFRKNKGLTQEDMARKIGVGIAQMRRYEKGASSPTLEVIKNIAKTLAISSDELIFDNNDGVPSSRIFDKNLLEKFEVISKLSHHDKDVVNTLLECVIIKNRIEEIIPAKTNDSWSREMKSVVTELRKGADEYSEDEIDSIVDDAVMAVRGGKKNKREKIGA